MLDLTKAVAKYYNVNVLTFSILLPGLYIMRVTKSQINPTFTHYIYKNMQVIIDNSKLKHYTERQYCLYHFYNALTGEDYIFREFKVETNISNVYFTIFDCYALPEHKLIAAFVAQKRSVETLGDSLYLRIQRYVNPTQYLYLPVANKLVRIQNKLYKVTRKIIKYNIEFFNGFPLISVVKYGTYYLFNIFKQQSIQLHYAPGINNQKFLILCLRPRKYAIVNMFNFKMFLQQPIRFNDFKPIAALI